MSRLRRTRDIQADVPALLFLLHIKPHNPVKSQRKAHWIKDTLKKAGVDTNTFKAHSVREASTSTAVGKGLHIADVLKTADWSSESTFRQFYYQSSTSAEKNFAQPVHNSASKMNHCNLAVHMYTLCISCQLCNVIIANIIINSWHGKPNIGKVILAMHE